MIWAKIHIILEVVQKPSNKNVQLVNYVGVKPLQQLSSMNVNEDKQTEKLTNFCSAIYFPLSIFYSYSHLVDAVFLEGSYP